MFFDVTNVDVFLHKNVGIRRNSFNLARDYNQIIRNGNVELSFDNTRVLKPASVTISGHNCDVSGFTRVSCKLIMINEGKSSTANFPHTASAFLVLGKLIRKVSENMQIRFINAVRRGFAFR